MLQVRRYTDVGAFLERAEGWLRRTERQHGLIYGIANEVRAGTTRYRAPLYWATVEDDAASEPIQACVFRTPPFQVGMTDVPLDAIEPLVASLRELYATLPGVGGPVAPATAFAAAWTRRFGGKASVLHRQRLHTLEAVKFPERPAPGMLRRALAPDVPVARAWTAGFIKDAGVRHVTADAGERLIGEGRLYFWVDGEPRTMVGAVRDTPHTTGIGAVYTPPRFRGRGYATAAVATLSRQLLDGGRSSCFLYTDLANPVSNAIYRRVGYEPLQDVVDIAIE